MRAGMSSLVVGAGLCAVIGGSPVQAKDEAELAELLIVLLKAGRALVSEHQTLINDATKGDKGFTDKLMRGRIIESFKAHTRLDLSNPGSISQSATLLAMLDSESEVVLEAQPIINKQGIAFKGFVPSVFARKVGQKFFGKTGIKIKLTGMDYRFPGNKPDDFEAEVLRMFADPGYPKEQHYARSRSSTAIR